MIYYGDGNTSLTNHDDSESLHKYLSEQKNVIMYIVSQGPVKEVDYDQEGEGNE